ncbi:hypothetical protein KM043_017613 [Ampulex compressa]|nr:hypothetical protein KM043_017613 [Ampulex compressa]
MPGWFLAALAALLALALYAAFCFKINWVRDLRRDGGAQRLAGLRKRKLGKLPPVYPNGWFALLESRQVKRGQVRHVAALGENFAVFRTAKGVVNILDAYCPHLGANMAEGGRVKGECLECPFHSWRFRGEDGHCESIPYAEKVPHIARARTWRSCEVNYIVFVWYHAESSEPDWQPQPRANISNGAWRYQGRNEFLVNCHIQDIAENGADVAHLSAVHGPAMFLRDSNPWLARHSWTNATWAAQQVPTDDEAHEIKVAGSTCARHKANMHLRHSLVLMERLTILNLDVNVEQIGPGYVELLVNTALGPMCILQTVTPMEPLLQRVTHMIFSPPLLAPYASLVFLGECLMFERDVEIWNHKKFERQPILVREDRAILAYRRWYSQFYSPRSSSYQAAMKSLQW